MLILVNTVLHALLLHAMLGDELKHTSRGLQGLAGDITLYSILIKRALTLENLYPPNPKIFLLVSKVLLESNLNVRRDF